MNSANKDKEWSRAFAEQALSDLQVMDLLRQSNLPECHYFHYLQMAAEKVCKAHLSLQRHEEVRKIHGYVASVLPVIARNLLAREQNQKERSSWIVDAIRGIASEIELLAPACHEEGSRPDNCEYPWENASSEVIAPCRYKFRHLTSDDRTMIRLLRVLRAAAEEYAHA